MNRPTKKSILRTSGLALLLALASCGDKTTEIAAETDVSTTAASTTAAPTTAAPTTGGEENPEEGTIIGTANINGEVISGAPHAIDSLAIAESAPEQLSLTFTAGAEPCLAADAIATATDTEVVVTLNVGINDQAAFTTCIAGLSEHVITIALDEPLDGREVVLG